MRYHILLLLPRVLLSAQLLECGDKFLTIGRLYFKLVPLVCVIINDADGAGCKWKAINSILHVSMCQGHSI